MSPLATHRWLVTTMTRKPASFSRAMASGISGKISIFSQLVMYWSPGAFRLITPSRSRNAALLIEDRLFNQLRNDVADQNVTFLDPGRVIGGDTDTKVRYSFELSTGSSR